MISIDTHAQESETDVHETLFLQDKYPAAAQCKSCHPVHYKEWSASPHAYAQLSPVFNTMQAAVLKLTNGTNGDFCIRCHNPVGMNIGEPIVLSNLDRHPISREGITCVTCHRRTEAYGKVSGRIAIEEGDLFATVYGSKGNQELKHVIESGDYEVNTERGQPGRTIHTDARRFAQITTSGFCSSCHDVNTVDGFRFEEAFSEYKSSPAAKRGVSCQDCHMGREPGVPSGYAFEPVALVGGKPTRPRKRTNHLFVGPDYSIIHPALFPHNTAAQKLASYREWLAFDHEAGWGTDAFEDTVLSDYVFPERWSDVSDRYEARDVINENLKRLGKVELQRKKLLQTGYRLGDVVVDRAASQDIQFKIQVKNGTDGHNAPTGFDGDRLVFLQVTVSDRHDTVVFKSGDLDPNGDVRDAHSLYVENGVLKRDEYLFNLQSRFMIRMIRGSERGEVLPINYSQDPLPFIRPSTRSTLLQGRPDGARKHRRTIRPGGSIWAKYKVELAQLAGTEGPYKANIKIIAGMVPVNLIHAIQDAGFDYCLSPRKVAEKVVAGHQVLWERDVVLKGNFATPDSIYRENTLAEKSVDGGASRLTDQVIPLQPERFPRRPKPFLELGNAFLNSGKLDRGIRLPTDAVWQPSFTAWGTYRSAMQSFDDGVGQATE
jgi:nitrate/TMAO reductase-like tetraheme cytochrome c subunit